MALFEEEGIEATNEAVAPAEGPGGRFEAAQVDNDISLRWRRFGLPQPARTIQRPGPDTHHPQGQQFVRQRGHRSRARSGVAITLIMWRLVHAPEWSNPALLNRMVTRPYHLETGRLVLCRAVFQFTTGC